MIWFTLDNYGNVKNIFKITNLSNPKATSLSSLDKYKIDTSEIKIDMQKFLELSRKYKFGHIKVNKEKKIYLSSHNFK